MSRRKAILALLALPLGAAQAWAQTREGLRRLATPPGRLTVNLDQWAAITVTFKGQQTDITAAEIFAALKETTK